MGCFLSTAVRQARKSKKKKEVLHSVNARNALLLSQALRCAASMCLQLIRWLVPDSLNGLQVWMHYGPLESQAPLRASNLL